MSVCSTVAVSLGVDDVVARRLRTQRLTSTPLSDATDVVRLLTCVQAQDAPLARFSVGVRMVAGHDGAVRRAIDDGHVVRTHILRPTWHFVAAEDLRWILALTSAKVESGMAARHRQLGLDSSTVDGVLASLAEALAGRRYLTRRELAAEFEQGGATWTGEQLGHLLMLAELRALVCSGPLRGEAHTYGLVDELVAPTALRDRPDAIRELVSRFFTGHGPASVTDLTRWTRLTQGEVKAALEELVDHLDTVTVDGVHLWFDAAADPGPEGGRRALLLPVFDEAYLSYPSLNVLRADGHPGMTSVHRFAEAGGGVVILDRRDVGWWKRRNRGRRMAVSVSLASTLDSRGRDLVVAEAERLAAFADRTADVVWL